MSAANTRSSNPAIREVSRGLAAARDAQILRVVAMVDAMPNRGAADQLIAPLRERLARLRPPRPLRFARLLFMPLDPLIVPAARWRADDATIPRTVIPPLAAMVEARLGLVGQRVATLIDGRTTADLAATAEAGAMLWRPAAELLLDSPVPDGWDTTGLDPRLHKPLARRIAALLFQAERLCQMMDDAARGLPPPPIHAVRTLLEDAMRHDPDIQPMAVALLLARVPEVAPSLLRVGALMGGRTGALMRHSGERAADILLDQLDAPGGAEAQLGGRDLTQAGATVRRLTSLLGALDGEMLTKDRRDRLNGVRQRIRDGCQSLFAERLATDLLEPLSACAQENEPGAVWGLEDAARGLRALETEARRAGGDKTYDGMLDHTADMVREKLDRGELDRTAGLRLLEIVAGPEAALAILDEDLE